MPLERPTAKTSGPLLTGKAVGISVAYGEDSATRGFAEEEMNRSVVRLAEELLAAGANLVFGHDWRPNGVMAAVARLAVRYDRPSDNDSPRAPERCRITNLVPWDRQAELPRELRAELEERGILRVEEIPFPTALVEQEAQLGRRTLRAVALCLLRRRLAELCHARVCLGGKYLKYEGFWPGILEEAWTGARRRHPVFLSEILGGASSQVLEASQTGQWQTLSAGNPDEELRGGLGRIRESRVVDLPDFADVGSIMNWQRLQANSGLVEEDWRRLAAAADIEVITALVLKGLRGTAVV